MSIVLTQAERIAVSRRMVKIPIESGGFDDGIVNMAANEAIFASVDAGNKKFFDHWNTLFNAYFVELIAFGVTAPDTITEANFNDGAGIEFATNLFYPVQISPPEPTLTLNQNLAPLLNPTTATPTTYDFAPVPSTWSAVVSGAGGESDIASDLAALCQICLSGIDVGVADTYIPASPFNDYSGETHLHIFASDTPVGSYVIVSDNVGGGGYVVAVTGATVSNVTPVRPVCGSGTCVAGASTIVRQQATFWSNAERNNLATATPYTVVASSVYNYMIVAGVTSGPWDLKLDAEIVGLVANDDRRIPQKTEISSALAAINAPKAAIAAWTAFTNTDGGGNSKFNDTALTAFSSAAAARTIKISSRISEIVNAAGTLVAGSGGTFSGTPGFVYNRFDLLDKRINRQYGSLRRYYNQIKSRSFMQNLSDTNSTLLGYYETVMVASKFATNATGGSLIKIVDTAGFFPGDVCYVYDEIVGIELSGIIVGVNPADGSVQLSFDVPDTYLRENLSRLYKIL